MKHFLLTIPLILLILAGCGGQDSAETIPQPQNISADTLAEVLENKSAMLINVHVPYTGEIEQTDAFIRFDDILNSAELPANRNAPIILYCQSGNMSTQAANTLAEAGYTNISNLEGGMLAWERAGYERIIK